MRPFCLASLVLGTSACTVTFGNGTLSSETRTVTAFERVSSTLPVDVEITRGDSLQVGVSCDENLIPLILTEVRDDTLELSTPTGTTLSTALPCKVSLQAQVLEAVQFSGSGGLTATGPFTGVTALTFSGSGDHTLADLTGEGLAYANSGSADVVVTDVAFGTVSVTSSGSGDTTISGEADTATVVSSGSGDLDMSGLPVTDATVTGSGSGDILLQATGSVTGSLSGSGDLVVSGGAEVDVAQTGSGELVSR